MQKEIEVKSNRELYIHADEESYLFDNFLGVVGEHNATVLNFTFPDTISGYDISELTKKFFIKNTDGTVTKDFADSVSLTEAMTTQVQANIWVELYHDGNLLWYSIAKTVYFAPHELQSDLPPTEQMRIALADILHTIDPDTDYSEYSYAELLAAISPLSGKVDDVKVDGTSVVTDKVANIDLSGKQNVLVSGENIKTVDNQSILGSGNIDIQNATSSRSGVVKVDPYLYGVGLDANGKLQAEVFEEIDIPSDNTFISQGTLNNIFDEHEIDDTVRYAMRYKGDVALKENLPSTASVGDVYHVTSERCEYMYIEDSVLHVKKWTKLGIDIEVSVDTDFYVDDPSVTSGVYCLYHAEKVKSRYTSNQMSITAPAFLFKDGNNITIYDAVGYHKILLTQAIWQPESLTTQSVKNDIITAVTPIEELIPEQATSSNQLADKAFVNSTVGTNTAIFRGTYNSLAELETVTTKTNNDYAFVIGTDSAGNTVYNRYKYNGTSWVFEYALNNSSFTAEQWAAINSGITAQSYAGKEDKTNKVTSISSESTNTQYPSAKAVYDFVDSGYVEQETGKGLSTNDFTTAEKTKLDGINMSAKQDKPSVITTGTTLTLADNTEYRLTIVDGDTATFQLPSGNYECYMRLIIASEATFTITFTPASGSNLKYIGSAPEFVAGDEWEISIKDGVIVAGKVVTAE